MDTEVLVVIGVGGIGQAIARRQGPGRSVVLADFDDASTRRRLRARPRTVDTLQVRWHVDLYGKNPN